MTDLKLETLSLKELKTLQTNIVKAISTYQDRQVGAARAALQEHARSLGFSLEEIVGVGPGKATRAPAKAKYRHPENAEITWSGRGRRPAWFASAISAGKKPGDLAV